MSLTVQGPAACAQLLARLRDTAGVQAAVSLSDINPPAVLLQSPAIIPGFKGRDCLTFQWTIWCIGPGLSRPDALTVLFDLVERVGDELAYPWAIATPIDVQSPTGAIWPAYEMTWQSTI